jgi:hypothetical protein
MSKKMMLEEDDFDMQINSQEGTKIIKLSSFNEKELGGDRGERKVMGQEFEEYKETADFRPVSERTPTKKGLFGWKKKPSKDEDLKANSTVKSQPSKPAQGQGMPQSMPPKQQQQKWSLPPQQQSSQMQPIESLPTASAQNLNSASPDRFEHSTNSQEEDSQIFTADPVLMKNTDFNAAFIHVGNLGSKAKPKNTSKGVKFASTTETITAEISSDEEEMFEKPAFAPRGSSMKNVDNNRQSTLPEPAFSNRNESSRRNDPVYQDNRQNFSRPASVINPEVLQENRQKTVTKQTSRSDLSFPVPPTMPTSVRNTGPSPTAEQVEYQSRNNLMPQGNAPESARKRSPTPSSTTDTSVQTDKDDRENLINMISTLQAQVSNLQEESIRQQQVMQEQKNGFDKLSAQAYKKIKGLLTERNIMTIELKSLKAQVRING